MLTGKKTIRHDQIDATLLDSPPPPRYSLMHFPPGSADAYGVHNGSYAPSGSCYLQWFWSEFRRSVGGYSRRSWPLLRVRFCCDRYGRCCDSDYVCRATADAGRVGMVLASVSPLGRWAWALGMVAPLCWLADVRRVKNERPRLQGAAVSLFMWAAVKRLWRHQTPADYVWRTILWSDRGGDCSGILGMQGVDERGEQ